jgi:intracellular sulfur oxidation DsrE/DsrF family protein
VPDSAQRPVFVFAHYGMGDTNDAELKLVLAKTFFALIADAEPLPAQICFFTDGVRLCVDDSPVLPELRELEAGGVELVLCATCLDRFGLRDQVAVGVVGGMGDIITSITGAANVISL